MDICLHDGILSLLLTLAGFEPRVGLADHVEATAATDHLAIRVAVFQGLDGRCDFHFRKWLKERKKGSWNGPVNPISAKKSG
jgi:hypothetical protein